MNSPIQVFKEIPAGDFASKKPLYRKTAVKLNNNPKTVHQVNCHGIYPLYIGPGAFRSSRYGSNGHPDYVGLATPANPKIIQLPLVIPNVPELTHIAVGFYGWLWSHGDVLFSIYLDNVFVSFISVNQSGYYTGLPPDPPPFHSCLFELSEAQKGSPDCYKLSELTMKAYALPAQTGDWGFAITGLQICIFDPDYLT